MHGPEQPVAAAVAGEHPTRAVRTVGRRSEAEHDDARRRDLRTRGSAAPSTSSSRYAARFSTATCSRHATRRGHARQPMTSCSSLASAVTGVDSRLGVLHGHHEAIPHPRIRHPSQTCRCCPLHDDAPRPARPDPDHRQGAARTRAKGLHLADEGRRQADIAAARIAELKRVDAIYSSPLERANETAAPDRGRAGPAVHRSTGACSSATSATGPAPN